MTGGRSTVTVTPGTWAIDDPVLHLRLWETDTVFPLVPGKTYTIGTSPECEICVRDPQRGVSRAHASVTRRSGVWMVRDLESKNGTQLDGITLPAFPLVPGSEIRLGGRVTLVAESAQLRRLRAALARMIGWSHAKIVDFALRGTRLAAMRRAVLVMAGEHELVPLAQELHELVFGAAAPFVVCAPNREKGYVHPQRCVRTTVEARHEARGGTICLLQHDLPKDVMHLFAHRKEADDEPRVTICSANVRDCQLFTDAAVVVPPLRARASELARLVQEYEARAVESLKALIGRKEPFTHEHAAATAYLAANPQPLTPVDRSWLRGARSLPDMEKMTLRAVAARVGGSASAGAWLLGITPRGFLKWMDQRGYRRHVTDW